jgi:hypothetical protein
MKRRWRLVKAWKKRHVHAACDVESRKLCIVMLVVFHRMLAMIKDFEKPRRPRTWSLSSALLVVYRVYTHRNGRARAKDTVMRQKFWLPRFPRTTTEPSLHHKHIVKQCTTQLRLGFSR